MNKSEKNIRLAMIKAIGERRKVEIKNKKLKSIIKSLVNCENCGNFGRCEYKEKLKCINNNHQYWIMKK